MDNRRSSDWMIEYRAWKNMLRRCYNPKCVDYSKYGGRGITVCDRWREDFFKFLEDVGVKLDHDLSLERIDNNGNYEPGNVKWATAKEQQIIVGKRRRRDNHTGVAPAGNMVIIA